MDKSFLFELINRKKRISLTVFITCIIYRGNDNTKKYESTRINSR